MFDIYVTVDIAAESNKISGNELRDIIYSEVKTYQKIGEHTVDLREFSITNLEGKISCSSKRHRHILFLMGNELLSFINASCIFFNFILYLFIFLIFLFQKRLILLIYN